MSLKNSIHRTLAPLIYKNGTAIVPGAVSHLWPQRQFLRRILKQLMVDCVFDVGANIGLYGSELRLVGYSGIILSFEPDQDCFRELLRISSRDHKWHCFNVALGAREGVAAFNIMKDSLFNSFRFPADPGSHAFVSGNEIKESIEVPVQALSYRFFELRQQFGFERPFLKMDTQGFDLEVFSGAGDRRADFVGLQSEISIKALYKGTLNWREAISRYEDAGFELAALYQVNPELSDPAEFDCYMRRTSA